MTAVVTWLIIGAFAVTVAYIAVAVWHDTPKPPRPLTPLRDRQIAAVVARQRCDQHPPIIRHQARPVPLPGRSPDPAHRSGEQHRTNQRTGE